MNIELNNKEIDFIIRCIHMAAAEGFYEMWWSKDDNYDYQVVGKEILEKLGMSADIIERHMDGI